jgi:FKBP-type peptidyl-prolyl cis-trans isomerase (trigger factor)
MELKSKIQKLHEIDTSKELVITRLMADRNMIEAHRKRLSDLFKNDTPEQINNKVNNIIVRNNVFNAAMNEIIKAYQVTFDSEEVNNTISRIKPQFPTATEDNLKGLAQRVILKALVFQDLVQA